MVPGVVHTEAYTLLLHRPGYTRGTCPSVHQLPFTLKSRVTEPWAQFTNKPWVGGVPGLFSTFLLSLVEGC